MLIKDFQWKVFSKSSSLKIRHKKLSNDNIAWQGDIIVKIVCEADDDEADARVDIDHSKNIFVEK